MDRKIFYSSPTLRILYANKVVAMRNGLVIGSADKSEAEELYLNILRGIENNELPQGRFTIIN